MAFRTLLAAMAVSTVLLAQYTTGRVEGTVVDRAGGSIAGTTVTLLNPVTNTQRSMVTEADGAYVFPSMPPGRYRMAVTKDGFAPLSTDVLVTTSQTTTRDVVLEVGQGASSIEVTATTPDLNSVDPQRSVTRSQLEIETLPNLSRNAVALFSLAPGVQPTFSPRGGALVTVSGAQAGQIAANGGRSKATSHQLDYTDANDWEFGGIALNTQPTPEMLQELRVLTNNWSAEYGVKSNAQVVLVTRSGSNEFHGSAYNFFQNSALNARDYFDTTGKATTLRQNFFGFTAGGHLARDRTFFFGGYEGRETRGAGSTVVANLPTEAARARAASPVVRELLQAYLPLPTVAGTNADVGTLSSQLANPSNSDMFIVRGDHYFTQNHSLSARYFQHTGTSFLRLANTLPRFDATFDPQGRNAMLADTYVVDGRTTNELRLAYGRSSALFTPENNLLTPRFVVLGLVSFGMTNNWPQGRIFNVYQINDVLNLVRGRHALKFGFDLRRIQDNSINDTNRRGVFTFPGLNALLAGQPSNYTQTFGNTYRGFRTDYHGAFVQDDVRVARTITLNLGLRWEYQGGLGEVNELMSVLDPRSREVGPLGSFRTKNPIVEGNAFLLSPRFGVNWNPGSGNIVVRAGYGVYWDSFLFNGLQAGRTTPPNNYIGNLAGAQIAGENGFESLLAGRSPFQRGFEAQLGTFGSLTNFGRVVTTDPRLRNPYVQHFNIGMQRRFWSSLVADVAYVGTKGTALTVYGPANSVMVRPAPAMNLADEQARLPEFQAAVARQNGAGNTRLDPRFNDVDRIEASGSSIYHSLQFEVRKSYGAGLTMQASYTWAKSLDNSSDYSPGQQSTDANFAQNQFDLRNERSVSNFDIPHRLVISHVWQLPGRMLRGWAFSSINQIQSGIPATILAGPRLGITDVNMDGNLVQGGDNTRANCDTAGRYSQPLLGNTGTCGRNTYRMNRLVNLDWSLARTFRIAERAGVEFRSDFFNVFNVPFLTAAGNEWRTVSSPQFLRFNAAGAPRRIQLALRLTW